MTSLGAQQQLLGRESECADIGRLLADAGDGVGRARGVRGETGIGKSALLEYAARHAAAGTLVLRADGVEAEADLPFTGLHGLLRPIFRHLEELPRTQRDALAGALGLAPSSAPDRLLVSAAVIGLLAAAAEEQPVLCLADDAQWLDRPLRRMLRRDRQRSIARLHVRAASELFQSLRAVPWADRADAELRATGETARKRDASALTQLTAQEVQIAGLVAEGLTSKEIAAQLYLSPRTVDYHLRKVFAKLGIGSRADLVRHGLPGLSRSA